MGVFATVKSPSANGVESTVSDKFEPNMSDKCGTGDEPEEGEIIDEYEDIISSDEEFSMRQRIEELEAKNAELEKIANISAVYGNGNYDYMKNDPSSHHSDRYPLVSIDISDDEDYPPPAPRMSRVGKRRKSIQHSASSRRKAVHSTSTGHRRRKKSSSPPPAPPYRAADKLLLSMFHERVVGQSSHSSKRKRKSKKSHSTKISRKSREYYVSDSDGGFNFDHCIANDDDDGYENHNSSDGERSFSLNREELRVALARNTHRNEQHVSLKDRLIRRKENTDTLNEKQVKDPEEAVEEVSKPDSSEEKVDTEDNLEEQELRIIALKSAVIRKHMVRKKRNENIAYSPSDFDEIYNKIAGSPSMNNMDEADTCNSMEISPVPSPKMMLSDEENMKPIDMDIVNSDSDCDLPAYEKWVPIEQIPLPTNIEIGKDLYAPTPLRYNDREDGVIAIMPPAVRFGSALMSPGNLDSEVEEEEALRALLLAKMNSPKATKIVKQERPQMEEVKTPDQDISLEAEVLRNFLINTMKKKSQVRHSPSSVLKEAVRRLTAVNNACSPVDGFSEILRGQIKSEYSSKTAEETEIELGQAINEMARVKIEARRDVESKEIVKSDVFKRVDVRKGDVESREDSEPKDDLEDAKGQREDTRIPAVAVDSGRALESISTEAAARNDDSEKAVISSEPEMSDRVGGGKGKDSVEPPCSESSLTEKVAENKKDGNLSQDNGTEKMNEIHLTPSSTPVDQAEDGKEKNPQSYEESSETKREEKGAGSPPVDQITSLEATPKLDKGETPEKEEAGPAPEVQNDTLLPTGEQHVVEETIAESNSNSQPEIETKQTPVPTEPLKTEEIKPTEKKQISPKVIPQSVLKVVEPKETPLRGPLQSPGQLLVQTSVSVIKVEKHDKPMRKPTPTQLISKKTLPPAQTTHKLVLKASKQQPTAMVRKKIVKPNKVINQPILDLKRKPTDIVANTSVPMKKTKIDESTNRLITATEVPQVKKLIIELRASDTESEYSAMSGDEYEGKDGAVSPCIRSFVNRSITIGNDYCDIASPISLPMDSPCDTPTRAVSPLVSVTSTPQPIVAKSIVNDFFEAKLDQFLRNVRSKVADSTKPPVEDVPPTTAAALNTPVAVRHLPEASQQEYRRLIHRMKILERQKQAKNLQVTVNSANGDTSAGESSTVMPEGESQPLVRKVLVKNASANTAKPICDKKTVEGKSLEKEVPPKPKTAGISVKTEPKSAISTKSVLSPPKAGSSSPTARPVAALKPSKENLLVLYENSFRKIGTSIISNLDRNIELVRVANEAKMAKLKQEHRLQELRKQMDEVQRKLQQHQERITKIYPEICNSNRVIESLKTRRAKINKAVTTLGQSVIGPNYSMNNDQKSIISKKSKQLAAEIKIVNTMKLSDVEKWESQNHRENDSASVTAPPKDLDSSMPDSIPTVKSEKNDIQSSNLNRVPANDNENRVKDNENPVEDNKNPVTITVVNLSIPEVTQNGEPKQNDTIVPETILNKGDEKYSTNGHEEALEIETVGDKQADTSLKTLEETNGDEKADVGGAKLQDYVSPLSHLRDERQINPNGIVCPYQLMGQCDDKDCKYMHLDDE